MAPGLPRRVYAAVFLLSLGVLVLQIALNRVFSFTIWHHFAYMSISFALLGFGASGAMLAAFPRLAERPLEEGVAASSALAAAFTLVLLVVVGSIPLHPHRLLQDAAEPAKLLVYFGLVSVPFFLVGLAIALSLRAAGRAVNRLYFWDLVGAGLGCALSVAFMDLLGPPRVVVLVALLFALAGALVAGRAVARWRRANLGVGLLLLAAIGPVPDLLPFTPSADKPMSRYQEKGASHYRKWSALFRTDVHGWRDGSPRLDFLRTLGISPRYQGPVPPYLHLTHDAASSARMYHTPEGSPGLAMFRHQVLSAPYLLLDRPEVLVIGVGGGLDIVTAVENGARRVVGAELDPWAIRLLREDFREYTGGYHHRPEVELRATEGRHFVRAAERRFDLIQLTGVDTFAALSSVSYVTSESYLYTVEAYRDFFRALTPSGMLGIGTFDGPGDLRHARRFVGISRAVLEAEGVERPGDHIAVIALERPQVLASEILTAKRPFSEAEIAALERFCDEQGFAAWYLPNRPERQEPAFRELIEARGPEHERLQASSFLEMRPPTDDWPFFFGFYKWRHLLDASQTQVAGGYLLALGLVLWIVMLGVALLISGAAIGLPMWRAEARASDIPGRWGFLLYFSALGVGFIFLEITFVQRFILFLGHPTYALTVMLFAFLSAAGLGAYASDWLPDRPSRVLPALVAVLSLLVLLYRFLLPGVFESLLSAPLALRIAVTAVLCAPVGAVLGMFFPYGLRLTSSLNQDFVAWAWAANGCLTVVGSITSVILAMTFGFTAVMFCAVAIYWIGAGGFIRSWGRAASL